jgi:hypothetical protein
MTVKELIKHLQGFDGDALVVLAHEDEDAYDMQITAMFDSGARFYETPLPPKYVLLSGFELRST